MYSGETMASTLIDRLREREWRLTAQRRVVAQVLTGDHVHLTAETVHAQARAILPEISLATVYNTLNELVVMGELREVQAGDGPKRYDPNVTSDHQHLQCVRCGALWDVVPNGATELGLPDHEQHGFRLLNVDIVFRGLCPTCNNAPG